MNQTIIDALNIAVNHYEYEGDFNKVEELSNLIKDIKNACRKCGKVGDTAIHNLCNACYYGLKENN